jgi:mersacidin/lichenicidin family type 2 lantibiotic
MTPDQIIRAWKDEDFRLSLSAAEQALLPQNPAGASELSDEELLGVTGGQEDMAIVWTTVTVPITIGTQWLSCWPACGSSVHKGTCAYVTVGCCGGGAVSMEEASMY